MEPKIRLPLNSLVRIYAMHTERQIAEISRRMSPSLGYDYYAPLKNAVKYKISGESEDKISWTFKSISNPLAQSYNQSAYDNFVEKFGNKKNIELFSVSKKHKICNGLVEVKVSPNFLISTSSALNVYSIWPIVNPKLDLKMASLHNMIVKEAFSKTHGNYDFKVFDAVNSKTYSSIGNSTPQAFDVFCDTIENIISRV